MPPAQVALEARARRRPRSLRSHRTNVIGVLVAEFEPFSTELLKGVSSAIDETGYELLAYSGGHHGRAVGWERRSLSRLGGTLIDLGDHWRLNLSLQDLQRLENLSYSGNDHYFDGKKRS